MCRDRRGGLVTSGPERRKKCAAIYVNAENLPCGSSVINSGDKNRIKWDESLVIRDQWKREHLRLCQSDCPAY